MSLRVRDLPVAVKVEANSNHGMGANLEDEDDYNRIMDEEVGVREIKSETEEQDEKMIKLGLPSAFNNGIGGFPAFRGKKRKFYCDVCLVELNSEDTMRSHIQVRLHSMCTGYRVC